MAAPLVALLAWFTVWPLAVGLMTAAAPQIPLGPGTPADHGLAAEAVTSTAPDGVVLAGWYIPSRNGVAVVLRHGASSTRTAVLGHAAVLAAHGYGVLAADARGVGESGGHANLLGWYGDLDVAAAVDHLTARPEVDRVVAVGLSMGGEEVLGAAAADDRVLAVVAEGASGRSVADDDLALPDTPLRWMNIARDVLTTAVVEVLSGAHRPIALEDAVAATAPRPVLLITGAESAGGEVEVGRRLADRFPSVTLWEVAGGGHIGGLATDPDRWEAEVVGFLDRAVGLDTPAGR